MEATLETKTEAILEFVHGPHGTLHVSSEEETWAAWLHDLLKPHVTEVLVCDSRKNTLLRIGNQNDREDARKLKKAVTIHGLNKNHNRDLKLSLRELPPERPPQLGLSGILQGSYRQQHENADGAPDLGAQDRGHHFARWKKGVRFDAEQLKQQAA